MLDIETLTKEEIKILEYLKEKKIADSKKISEETNLEEIKVLRAIQWLSNKKFIELKIEETEEYKITSLGRKIIKEGLPEEKFLKILLEAEEKKEKKTEKTIEEETSMPIQKISKEFEKTEFNAALGKLKKEKLIILEKGKIKITEKGKQKIKEGFETKKVLEQIKKLAEIQKESEETLQKETQKETKEQKTIPEEKIKELIERNFIEKQKKKKFIAKITIKAEKLEYKNLDLEENLTSEMIKTKSYKNKKFRKYDVKIQVPEEYHGRRHFINEAIEFVKQVWLELGFEEMKGNIIQNEFWNFDVLFTPQDHPAREMQDTFFIKNPKKRKITEEEKKIMKRVKKTHETGWTTKSKGYQYKWKKSIAERLLLRTHTTVLSAQTIAKTSIEELPKKYFSVGKVFRNETLDWKHLFEFDQVEGIVIDKKVNFKHLKAYLELFFKKLGYEKIRLRPAYFPYTELSVEVDVYHPIKKTWVELGGAGIFRPEVVKPLLGKEIPVLAWGLGFGRIIADYYKINDLREFNDNNLKKLRTIKGWL